MEDSGQSDTKTLQTPAHISSLAFDHRGHLFAGSDDGTVRLYDLATYKVSKAIRGLKSEVSSIACFERSGVEWSDAWIACGRKILSFQMDIEKLIMTAEDASLTFQVCEDEEDVLNEISFDGSKKNLAFSTDSGSVGVLDLTTKKAVKMKIKHANICANVKFIPDRPREIVSSGYDETLLHFDSLQGSVLSKRKMPLVDSTVDGMALSPPFIMCTAISPAGVLAAGLGDGRLWLGFGGEKSSSTKNTGKKRARKWNGLSEEGEIGPKKIADGPVIAAAFIDNDTLAVSTLLGTVKVLRMIRVEDGELPQIKEIREIKTEAIEKVNTLAVLGTKIAIGGFAKDGKGIIVIWDGNFIGE
ncbi:hypothetical protein L218DRAFT_147283 [Marasmius fiardii PR-910]|nr:hypothetical protein L218DRAFT_147283 [Marasmius fiardii PR-910]